VEHSSAQNHPNLARDDGRSSAGGSSPRREHRRHKGEGREYREEKEEHVHRTEERPQAAWCALPDDLLSRGEHQAHVAPSTTYVGTTLPAPAVTLMRALDETRASPPETRPQ